MIFDSHLHIIDTRFPLVPNHGYLPPEFTCEQYLKQAAPLGVTGGAIVSGSFQAFDQTYLVAALERLGPAYVGVTQLPPSARDKELIELDARGVRAIRFNLKRGGSAGLDDLVSFASRAHAVVGWHVELYVDGSLLEELRERLRSLPRLVIDHLGLVSAGLPALYKLVESGARVKATGFGRLDFNPAIAIRQIAAINPGALMFGTDLPSTRARRPFSPDDLTVLRDELDSASFERAVYWNAVELYRPSQTDGRHRQSAPSHP
jgi:predicted TIM-barrel fold metal-dependent hydrolase